MSGSRITLDEIPEGDHEMGGVYSSQEWRVGMYAKVRTIADRVTEMEQLQVSKFAEIDKRLRTIEGIVRGLAVAPARVGGLGVTTRGSNIRRGTPARTYVGPATLVNCPRTLEVLWDEYQNGIGGPSQLVTSLHVSEEGSK